jgi:hypothetical protein
LCQIRFASGRILDAKFADGFGATEVADILREVVDEGPCHLCSLPRNSFQMPTDQHVTADCHKVILVPHSLVLRKHEVFFGCCSVVRLVMNRSREADFRKAERWQLMAQ